MADNKSVQLCPNCKTGMDTYQLDSKSPFCPYLGLHKGNSCGMYNPVAKNNKSN